MSINASIQKIISQHLGEEITSDSSVSGGCIADSRIITTNKGKSYFLKVHQGKRGMFLKEAKGLKELAKPACIRVPQVILSDDHFLLLEHITEGSKNKAFFESFGEELAQMHQYQSDHFGFYEDNYIGAGEQFNIAQGVEKTDWAAFYLQKRIIPQFRMAEQNGYANKEMVSGIQNIENKIDKILEGSEEEPTLLHGDLWGGNYLCDTNGKAVLIDPAVYYGHREADLAMTKMFGGFSPQFYAAYQKAYPLKEGWQYRENIYLLYHYMNHMNLFGMGYYQSTINIMQSY